MTQLADDCFAGAQELMPLDEAVAILEKRVGPVTASHKVTLANAAIGILAEDVVAALNVPPHDNSAVDGYAFRHGDLSPTGKTEFKMQGGKGAWSERPASNHRGELSIAFSEDDGEGWSRPVVIARQPGASLAYSYVFESEPGNLWITTMQGGIRLQLKEADFLVK